MKLSFCRRMTAVALGLVAAGTVHAQTSVKLSGVVDMGFGYLNSGGQGAFVGSGDHYSTSNWSLSGSEDLGNGNKAIFAIASFFDPATGKIGRMDTDVMFNKEATVGLGGTWGTVQLGKAGTPFASMLYGSSPFGGSSGFNPMFRLLFAGDSNDIGASFYDANVGDVHPIPYDTQWSNSIKYTSPNFGGLTVTVIGSPGEVAGNASAYRLGGSAVYMNGPLTLGGAVQRVGLGGPITSSYLAETSSMYENGVTTGSQLAYLFGAAYEFKIAKVYGQYAQVDNDSQGSSQHTRAFAIGAKIPLGTGYTNIAWGRSWQGTGIVPPSMTPGDGSCYAYCGGGSPGTGYVGIPKAQRDTFSIAYLYPMSKRTEIYAGYRYENWDPESVGFKGLVTHYVTSGIRHSF